MQGDHQRLPTQDDCHRFGPVARAQVLEGAGRFSDLLRHGRIAYIHGVVPVDCDRSAPTASKKTGVVEHPKVFDHAGLLANEPPGRAGLPFI